MGFTEEFSKQLKKTGQKPSEVAARAGVAPSAITHLAKGRLRLTVPMAARIEKSNPTMDGLKLLRVQLAEEYPKAMKGQSIFKTTRKAKPVAKKKAKPAAKKKPAKKRKVASKRK